MGFLQAIAKSRWGAWVVHHFPPGQFGRYMAVGMCNAVFGYSTYAGLTALLTPHIPYAYMVASVLSNFLNITFAFLNYKWFIFKTKGRYFAEWCRCLVVYGGTMALGTASLPVVVFALKRLAPFDRSAPYVAGALLMGTTAMAGFLGHKNFSFASPGEATGTSSG
jgi:putative flippase GtrA